MPRTFPSSATSSASARGSGRRWKEPQSDPRNHPIRNHPIMQGVHCHTASRTPVSTKLSVNVNKVATLRNTRPHLRIPDVARAAALCLDPGAHGITVHPRPDRRHIIPADGYEIVGLLRRYPHADFNIEGNPFHGYMDLVCAVRPTQCTLVPADVTAAPSDHGWDLARDAEKLRPVVR